ncbi:unnamed protein product [Rhizophagus irregularis]|nr:unnamed protein product [Rhizophagus irregularis]
MNKPNKQLKLVIGRKYKICSTDNVYRSQNPSIMDTGHCKYLDNAFNKIGRYFKAAIQDSFADDDNDEPFRLYCGKILSCL